MPKKIEKKPGHDDPRKALAEDLRSLIPRLDAEGLAFLIEQARIHLYNMQVDELNKSLEKTAAGGARKGRHSKPQENTGGNMRFEGSPSGSSFYLVYNGQWVMFSREEIFILVRIVSGDGTDLEIRERLYNWIERERRDLFATIPIRDKFDDQLKKLVTFIKKEVSPKLD
jgi:hypothetical protein